MSGCSRRCQRRELIVWAVVSWPAKMSVSIVSLSVASSRTSPASSRASMRRERAERWPDSRAAAAAVAPPPPRMSARHSPKKAMSSRRAAMPLPKTVPGTSTGNRVAKPPSQVAKVPTSQSRRSGGNRWSNRNVVATSMAYRADSSMNEKGPSRALQASQQSKARRASSGAYAPSCLGPMVPATSFRRRAFSAGSATEMDRGPRRVRMW
mmetsp:Transcript_7980/g.27094  ORF Transcript_7980/g.27094 Transcript_7980/m.27094 type:complete len:209 (-) Transcript_7980:319-945(-)